MLMLTNLSGFNARRASAPAIGLNYLTVKGSTVNAASYNLSGYGITGTNAGEVALVMVASYESDNPEVPGSVSVGGVAATKLEGQATGVSEGDDFNERTNGSIWIATLGGSPTDTVDLSYVTQQANACAAVFILTNAQTTAHDTDWSNTSGAASMVSATVDVVKGGAVFFLGVRREFSPTGSVNNSLTEHDDVNMEGGFGGMLIASKGTGKTAAGETFLMTTGVTNNENLIAVAVSLAPVSA